jgi:hypothetical protein
VQHPTSSTPPLLLDTKANITCLQHRNSTSATLNINVCNTQQHVSATSWLNICNTKINVCNIEIGSNFETFALDTCNMSERGCNMCTTISNIKREMITSWIQTTTTCQEYCYNTVVWTSLGPLPWWVPGPTTRWAPGATRHLMAWSTRTTEEKYSVRKLYMSRTVWKTPRRTRLVLSPYSNL